MKRESVAHNLAVFSEVLLTFGHGVAESVRPAPVALIPAQRTIEEFLDTLRSAFVEPSKERADPPRLERLTAAGIPVVPAGEFEAAVRERQERRQLLRGFLDSERRDWP